MKARKEFSFNWQDIAVHITYYPDYSNAIKQIQGYTLAHIEVRAESPLPITKTGYRSIWLPNDEVEEQGGAEAIIRRLLDTTAETQEWQRYIIDQKQLRLF